MKKEDILTLLEHSKDKIRFFETNKINQVEFKNILENLRSTLDYIAIDIIKINSLTQTTKYTYFPYGPNLNKAIRATNSNFKDLESKNPTHYKKVIALHNEHLGIKWLYILCTLTNHVKHNSLKETNEHSTEMIHTNLGISFSSDCNNVVISDNTIIDKNGIRHNTGTLTYIDKKINITDTKDFQIKFITELIRSSTFEFQNKVINTQQFLEICHSEILDLTKCIYNIY